MVQCFVLGTGYIIVQTLHAKSRGGLDDSQSLIQGVLWTC